MGRKKRRMFLAGLAARSEEVVAPVAAPAPEVVVEQPVVVAEPVPVVEVEEPVAAKPVAKVTKAVKAK